MCVFVDPASLRHTLPKNNVDENLRGQLKKAAAPAQPDALLVMKRAHAAPLTTGALRKGGGGPGSELLTPVADEVDAARNAAIDLYKGLRALSWGEPRPPAAPAPLSADDARTEIVATARQQHVGRISKGEVRDTALNRKAATLLSPLTRAAVSDLRARWRKATPSALPLQWIGLLAATIQTATGMFGDACGKPARHF